MYAIVKCGGRQYRAEEGHSFSVEKLPYEVGDQVVLDEVLLLANGDAITIGQPTVTGASVTATVTDQYRGKKIFVWKYKPKKRYRKRRGHRQYYTKLRIDSIAGAGGKKMKAKAAPKKEEPKPEVVTEVEEVVAETPVVETAAVIETAVVEEAVVEEAVVEETVTEVVEETVVEEVVATETVETEVVETAVIETAVVDDLTKIEGIGPKTAEALAAAGIGTFAALANASADDVNKILADADGNFAASDPTTWGEQAALAEKGDWDTLQALQDRLDGGKVADDDTADSVAEVIEAIVEDDEDAS